MVIKPLNSRVLILVDGGERESPGGILLPDTDPEKPKVGTVVAIGPGKPKACGTAEGGGEKGCIVREPIDVKIGDRVIYTSRALNLREFTESGEALEMVDMSELHAIIEAPKNRAPKDPPWTKR